MNSKIKIYNDTGASINELKEYYPYIEFYQFPYDSADRNKKAIKKGIIKLALPSEAQWNDNHQTWRESNFTWEELPSKHFQLLKDLLEKNSKKPKEKIRRDILHLDSAVKMNCTIFITSDYEEVASNKKEIKNICGMEIFHIPEDSVKLIEYIQSTIKNKCSSATQQIE